MRKNLNTFSATEINKLFLNKQVSAQEIVDDFKHHIESTEKNVNAFLQIHIEDAYKKAEELDRKIKNGEQLGSLAAIPIAVKDNINMKGKITSCASKILENFVSVDDATVIKHLRGKDCIFIGKVNLDEFAMGALGTLSGVKQTKNPVNTDYVPGGSSSGSGAVVGARMSPVSLGSDTGGSVRMPAAFCGTYGLKPSYGAISRYGLVSFASSLDTIGILTNYPEDLKIVFDVACGPCSYDSTKTFVSDNNFENDLKKTYVGICDETIDSIEDKEIKKTTIDFIEKLSKHVNIVKISLFKEIKHSVPIYYTICCSEAASNLARYDGVRFGMRSNDCNDYFEMVCKTRSDFLGPEVKKRILAGTYILSEGEKNLYYKKADYARKKIKLFYSNLFSKCDYIITPISSFPPPKMDEKISAVQAYLNDFYTGPASLAKIPAVSIPIGFCNNGLPIGAQVVSKKFNDNNLIAFIENIKKMGI